MDLNWGPKQLDGAFGGAYRCYWIDGIDGMDVDTFSARSRKFLIELLSRETINRAVRSQATTWIRFVKDAVEQVELAFNSRMLAVYNLSDMDEIVSAMIEHMKQQIENSALRDVVWTDRIWSKASYRLREIIENHGNCMMYYLADGPEWVFVSEELMLINEDTELPPDYIQEW